LIFINDIIYVITSSYILLYADDLKLFRSIETSIDATTLQSDLDSLASWSEKNLLPFNIAKCEQLTFSCKKDEIQTVYKIHGTPLKVTELVRDLGIFFIDKKMTFIPHINQLIRKVCRVMGYILRNSKDFKNIQTLKLLYCAFVRSHLEFGMTVWNPISEIYSKEIESIQRRFLKYIYYKTFQYDPVDLSYSELLEGFQIDSLETRRKLASLKLVYALVQEHTRDSNLLREVKFRVPSSQNTRSKETFCIQQRRTKLQ